MDDTRTCIIVGTGHASAQLALSMRQEGWTGPILVLGEESSFPYHRPPLSKAYLSGEKNESDILIRSADVYLRQGIEYRLGVHVTSIDRVGRNIQTATGERLHYDKLAICTGARARTVDLPGSQLAGVHYLRNLKDVRQIRAQVRPGLKVVVVGGGYIGLETAAAMRKLGYEVTILEMAPRLLARVTSSEVSEFFQRLHREEGAHVCTNLAVSGFEGSDRVEAVVCGDGHRLPADLVVIGVGVTPNVELAAEAGLAVDNGILVDEFACTADVDIVAAGDCTMHPLPMYGHMRLESVPNATEQAKVAAATLCGKKKAYAALPWFWSDQYDVKLQIAGIHLGYDQIVLRGNRASSRSFAVFYFQGGRLIAADCINRPQEFIFSKRVIGERIKLDVVKLADESVPLKALLPS